MPSGQFYLKIFLQVGPKSVTFLSLGTISAMQLEEADWLVCKNEDHNFFLHPPPSHPKGDKKHILT